MVLNRHSHALPATALALEFPLPTSGQLRGVGLPVSRAQSRGTDGHSERTRRRLWVSLNFPQRDRACEENQNGLTFLCPHLCYVDEMKFD